MAAPTTGFKQHLCIISFRTLSKLFHFSEPLSFFICEKEVAVKTKNENLQIKGLAQKRPPLDKRWARTDSRRQTALWGESTQRSGSSAPKGNSASEDPIWSPAGPNSSQARLPYLFMCSYAALSRMWESTDSISGNKIWCSHSGKQFGRTYQCPSPSSPLRVSVIFFHVCTELW